MSILNAILNFIRALFGWVPGVPAPKRPDDLPDEVPSTGEPKWLKAARVEIGQAEIPGGANNPVILSYYAKAGFAGIKDETVPWCAGFVNAMLESSGIPGSKSLAARSFLNWGKAVKKPYPGCIVVLWRNSPESWEGHTGFYVGETATHIKILGGNQKNKVCVEEYPKHKLLGYREPFAPGKSRTVKAATANLVLSGIGGAVILDSQTQIMGISALIKEMGVSIPGFQLASYILCIGLLCLVIWARFDDAESKGR